MVSKMRRKHVPYFCEGCGKEEFEGRVFGQDRVRHLQAQSGDRTMYCQDCRPSALPPLKFLDCKLSSFFTNPEGE